MSKPTEVTDWAVSSDALKEPVPEDRKQTGWVKLSNGFGEKPPLKIYNGWMNLIGRWIAYLKSNQTPVGHIIYSTLSESQFLSTSPFGDWVLCDGRDVQGSVYQTLTNRTNVPDMRALFPLMQNSDLDPIFYSVVNESVSEFAQPLKYDKGSTYPYNFLVDNDMEVSFDISQVKMNKKSSSINSSGYFSVGQNINWGGRFVFDDNHPNAEWPALYTRLKGDSDGYIHRTDWEEPNSTEYLDNVYSDQKFDHSHTVIFGNQVTGGGASSNLPFSLKTASKIQRSGSKTVTVDSPANSRLLPKTYAVNMYVRIN